MWRKGNQKRLPLGEVERDQPQDQQRQEQLDRMPQQRQPDRMPQKCSQTLQMFDWQTDRKELLLFRQKD